MTIAWPENVPTHVRKSGYQLLPPETLLESEMERGHKLRRLATGTPEIHTCPIRMTYGQLESFETWLSDINPAGSLRFNFPHPITKAQRPAQIIPEDGRPYQLSPMPGRHWLVTIKLRLYP